VLLKKIEIFKYRLPLKNPLHLGDYKLEHREGALIALQTDDGFCGWGEAAPLPGFPGWSPNFLNHNSQKLIGGLTNMPLGKLRLSLESRRDFSPAIFFALHSAVLSLASRTAGVSPHQLLSPVAPSSLSLCALIDGSPESRIRGTAKAASQGYKTIKLKVGRDDLKTDIETVGRAMDKLSPSMKLRLDANQAWSPEETLQFCNAIPTEQIEFLEEPTWDSYQLPMIQEKTGIPCAVDETLQQLSHCLYKDESEGADPQIIKLRAMAEETKVWVWKPSLCYPPHLLGMKGSNPIVLSSAYESGVGTAAILYYAAAFSESRFAAGIDSYSRLAEDVLTDMLPIIDSPTISLRSIDSLRGSVKMNSLKPYPLCVT